MCIPITQWRSLPQLPFFLRLERISISGFSVQSSRAILQMYEQLGCAWTRQECGKRGIPENQRLQPIMRKAVTFKNVSQPEVTVTQARRRLPPPHLNLKQAFLEVPASLQGRREPFPTRTPYRRTIKNELCTPLDILIRRLVRRKCRNLSA